METQGDKRMNSTEEEAWKKFFVDNANYTEWFDNVVEVRSM